MEGSSQLTIGQVSELTGLSDSVLRAWERRFGFPQPVRGPGGQRRYPTEQIDRIREVVRDRESGLSLEAAVGRAIQAPRRPAPSIFAALSARPEVDAISIRKRELTVVVQGLEDEMMSNASRPVLVGGFQRERFFRQSERRWHDLARTAALTVARADFDELRCSGGVLEVPLPLAAPASREWSVIWDSKNCGFALAAWEVVGSPAEQDEQRCFELVWTAEPASVRRAARVAVDLAAPHAPELLALAAPHLEGEPPPQGPEFRRLSHLANRVLRYLVRPS